VVGLKKQALALYLMGFQNEVKSGCSCAKSSCDSSGFDRLEFMGMWKSGTPLATLKKDTKN
jgi:hypothetical protein